MGLSKFFLKLFGSQPKHNGTKKPDEDFSEKVITAEEYQKHLTADGELPTGWVYKHALILNPYISTIYAIVFALDNMDDVHERKKALQRLIANYYAYKEFCYGENECFRKHFSDTWEHCSDSTNSDFDFITKYEEELKSMQGIG